MTAEPVAGVTCLDRGCDAPAVARCLYLDHAAARCATPWCDTHLQTVGNSVYCARHAVLIEALNTEHGQQFNRPAVANRAASLVAWVARDLDQGVRMLLGAAVGDTSVERSPLHPLDDPDAVGQGWASGWRADRVTGPPVVVAVEAAETQDDEIIVTVNGVIVVRDVAPWIRARQRGRDVAFRDDAVDRASFYQSLLNGVGRGVAQALGRSSVGIPAIRYEPSESS